MRFSTNENVLISQLEDDGRVAEVNQHTSASIRYIDIDVPDLADQIDISEMLPESYDRGSAPDGYDIRLIPPNQLNALGERT